MSEAIGYTAWDDNLYEWPPPEGWYEASDGRWWPAGYGPDQAASTETAAVLGQAGAGTAGADQSGSLTGSGEGDETLVWGTAAEAVTAGDGLWSASQESVVSPSPVEAEPEVDDDERRRRMFEEPPPIDDLFGGVDPFAPPDDDDWARQGDVSYPESPVEATTVTGPEVAWSEPSAGAGGPTADPAVGPDREDAAPDVRFGERPAGAPAPGNGGSVSFDVAPVVDAAGSGPFGGGPSIDGGGSGLFGGTLTDGDASGSDRGAGDRHGDVETLMDRVPAAAAPLGLAGLMADDRTVPFPVDVSAFGRGVSPDDDTVAFSQAPYGWGGTTEEAADPGIGDPAPAVGPSRLRPLVAIGLALVLVGAGVAAYLAFRPDSGEASTAQTPVGGPGSVDQPYDFGTGVVVFYPDDTTGDERRWVIQVLDPVVDATSDLVDELAVTPPESGEVLALVKVRVTYQSGPEPGPMSQLRLNVVGASGTTYTAATDGCSAVPAPLDTAAELSALESTEGELCLAVAAEDLGSLLLAVQAGTADGTVHLRLQ